MRRIHHSTPWGQKSAGKFFQTTSTFWTRVEGHNKFKHLDFTSAGPESAFLRIFVNRGNVNRNRDKFYLRF